MKDESQNNILNQIIEEYWLNQFDEDLQPTILPTFNMNIKSSQRSIIEFPLEKSVYEKLMKICKNSDIGFYMILITALNSILIKYGNQEAVVGTSSFMMNKDFITNNLIFLRNSISEDKNFKESLGDMKKVVLDAIKYQNYPVEKLLSKLEQVDKDVNNLFSIAFSSDKVNEHTAELEKFDLLINYKQNDNEPMFLFNFNEGVYDEYIVKQFGNQYINYLSILIENIDKPLRGIDILTNDDKNIIFNIFNNTKKDFPKDSVFQQLFEKQVTERKDDIAVECGDEKLTYNELNIKANKLAHLLRKKGVARNCVVGICFERSIDMLVAILGIFKAGGAYIPIDPDYPEERIKTILQESGAKFFITKSNVIASINNFYEQIAKETAVKLIVCMDGLQDTNVCNNEFFNYISSDLCYDTELGCSEKMECEEIIDCNIITQYSQENPEIISQPSDLSYVIYTSGSTGKPKGAMVEQVGMINHLFAKIREVSFTSKDVIAQNSSHCFDISVWQFLSALLVGGKVIIYQNEMVLDPEEFINKVQHDKVSILEVVPTYLGVLLDILEYKSDEERKLDNIKYVFVTGEVVNTSLVQRWFGMYPDIKMVNAYGPTEASDDITHYVMDKAPEETSISIGRPIQNFNIYVVDDNLKLCPIGVKGELCVSGIGVGRGYLNAPEKTAKVFLEDPFVSENGIRMYKTGDIGRYLPTGRIEFFGRKDYQVKIRGFRIELGEIENELVKHESIKETVVIAKENETGEKYLIAYYIASGQPSISELREYLSINLPDYMVPSYFVQLDKFPLTPNGKVNRKALPSPQVDVDNSVEYVAGTNATENKLIELWQEILGNQKVGINDNFFEIGGHSLKATVLVGKIHKEFNIDISLRDVFNFVTVKEQAEFILNSSESDYCPLEKAPLQAYYEVSSAQKRMYILNSIENKQTAYNLPFAVIIDGALDIDKLEKVFKQIINRHETLRTSFKVMGDEIVQVINEDIDFSINIQELHIKLEEDKKAKLELAINKCIRPFDLSKAPLLRVNILKLNDNEQVLVVDMHHIISDGVSMSILTDEFIKLYSNDELPELKFQYKDYSVWQNKLIDNGEINRQINYWMNVFSDDIPVLNMPLDYKRPQMQSFEGNVINFSINKDIKQKLTVLAETEGATMYMLVLAAYTTLLYRYTGQEDIIVGSPIAGRNHDDLNNIIGMFVNTLAMRNKPTAKETFREYLRNVKNNAISAYENQDYQFEELVDKLNINRDVSRNAIFDTMLVFNSNQGRDFSIDGLDITSYEWHQNIAKFDLTLFASENDDGMEFGIEYCTKLFKEDTIIHLKEHFINLLEELSLYPDKKLNDLNMLTPEEKEKIVYAFNDTDTSYPREKTICELFKEQAEKTPDKLAVIDYDRSITYRELNTKANSISYILMNNGISNNDVVGIMMERSIELIVAILGVMKSGAAYLPIDISQPKDRIEYMLKDSEVNLVLAQVDTFDDIKFSGNIINLNDVKLYQTINDDKNNIVNLSCPEDVAYIIYTSGSTGKPKGTMIKNRGLVNYITWANKVYVRGDEIDFPLYSSISFDLTVTSIFTPLITGNKIVIYDEEDGGANVLKVFSDKKVQIAKLTPEHLKLIKNLDNNNSSIIRLIVGGEDLKTSLTKSVADSFNGKVEIYNEYGPTEATVGCMVYKYDMDNDIDISVPIGKPADNIKIYILDKAREIVPIGVWGEIYIGGDGIAKGYLNKAELTENKFVDNPYVEGTKMYATGDLARWTTNTNIEFMGRIDDQVKIKGYRIELGEIESNILKYEGISQTVVVSKENATGEKYICAYIISNKDIPVGDLREHLEKELPIYMIPSYFIQLEKMPLTANGKVDTKALPEPNGEINTGVEYVEPTNNTEKILSDIWQDILCINKIGIKDNFFILGGDSIKAIQIVARANQQNINITVKDIFSYRTIEEILKNTDYEVLKEVVSQDEVIGEIPLMPIQSWFIEQKFEQPQYWNQQNLFTISDDIDLELLEKCIKKLIEHHDALRIGIKAENEKVIQINRAITEVQFAINRYDLRDFSKEVQLDKLIEINEKISTSLDIMNDLLFKVVYFDLGDNGKRLLVSFNHWLIDVVSWSIIIEDLEMLYSSKLATELPRKTVSYKQWSEELSQYANSDNFDTDYWKNFDNTSIKSIANKEVGKLEKRDYKNLDVVLSKEDTNKLLTDVNYAYNTEINDILMVSLLLAYTDTFDTNNIMFEVEGHGREEFRQGIDVSRTVGWFTSIYPVLLERKNTLSEDIKYVKENLRSIPNKGLNFGVGRYILQDEYLEKICPEITFNYMGQFDNILSDNGEGFLSPAKENIGESHHKENHCTHLIDISGLIADGKLQIQLYYNSKYVDDKLMKKLAANYHERFEEVINHCLDQEQQHLTASDFDVQDEIDQEGFDMLAQIYDI